MRNAPGLLLLLLLPLTSGPRQGHAQPKLLIRSGDILAPHFDTDTAPEPDTPPRISIVGCRNGSFSGEVVVGSDTAVTGLSAHATDLKAGRQTIPASAIKIRYALPWGRCTVYRRGATPDAGRMVPRPGLLDLLAPEPPKEYPVTKVTDRRTGTREYGPVAPVWITVQVPRDAAPGVYSGKIAIRVEGQEPRDVPLEVNVAGWAVPDPAAWRTWVDLIQSPDTLAAEYGAAPWSEQHWSLIGQSMRFMSLLGNRIVYVPLICRTNMGHEESMVRWVRKPDGTCSYDFTVMERYLDTAAREMGKPEVVVFYVWENYMIRQGDVATGAAAAHEQQRILEILAKENLFKGTGPAVTTLDPATGAVSMQLLPHYTDPAARALWQPLVAELKQRMEKRGLAGAMMLGMINDCWPTKAEVQFFADIAPGMPWVLQAHFGRDNAYGLARIGYRSQVWSIQAARTTSLMGWRQPNLFARFERDAGFGNAPLGAWRFWGEYCITGNQRGVARLGTDFWPVMKDNQGIRRGRMSERYAESSWRNLGIYTSLLAPGEDGPVATARFELFREGIQECEARIAVERALADPAAKALLGNDLAARCLAALDERIARMRAPSSDWALGGGSFDNQQRINRIGGTFDPTAGLTFAWQERSATLYSLAAEVERKLPVK